MINMNREMTFISQYVLNKEFFLPDQLRKALNHIHYQIQKRRTQPGLAVHITNNIFKTKHGVNYTKEFLWKKYRARLAYIKNGKDEYKKWAIEMRYSILPKEKKLCECGCGQEVKNPKNRFIHGHNIRLRTKEEKELYVELMLKQRRKKKGDVIHVDF
jgi:hypothetical protein